MIYKHLNYDIYEYKKPVIGIETTVSFFRSSRDLDTAEKTITIDKFRNYSSKEAGVYLPGPDEKRFLQQIEIDASKNQQYL